MPGSRQRLVSVAGRDGAGVFIVGILRLHAKEMAINGERWFREIVVRADKQALIGHLVSQKRQVGRIPPGGPVGIGDGLKQLVTEGVIGGVDQLAVGGANGRVLASRRWSLPRFHREQYVPEIGIGDAAVIGAEGESGWIVRRITLVVVRGVKTGVYAWRQE